MNHVLRKPLASLVAFSLVLGLVPLHALADELSASSEEPAAQEQTLSEEDAPEKIAPAEEAPAIEADAAKSDVPKTDGEPVAQAPAPTGDAASAEKATPKKDVEQKADIASMAEAPKLTEQAVTISSLSMTVTPPEAGTGSTDAKPNVSVSTEGIASYTASWQDHTDVRSMEPETLDFVAGNTYYALITLHPAEGYAFKTNGHKSMDVYTNDTYYGGSLPANLDIETAGIYSGNGQLRMLVRVKATEVQPKYLCIGVSEGGTYSVATSDSFPHEGMAGSMNLAVNPGDTVTLKATPASGYVFKGFYTGIRQMDSSKEGYGFVTDYDPNSLVSSANPYTFAMSENVNIYALFAKPTITLHWSDIDNADLKEPVVFGYSGEDLFDAIKSGLHMSQGPNWEATAQIADHIESGYFTPEPMSSYSSRAELDDANVLYDEVTEDMDVYVCMNKVIDNVEVGIVAPVAGVETTTPGDAYSSHTNWHWDEQTNKPYFSVPSGAKFQIAFDPEDPSYEPSYWTEKVDKRYEFGNPFIGTFVTGETYYAQVGLKADFGYGFASANPYARDPEYSGTATVDGGSFENAFCDGIGYTDYLILAASTKAAPDGSAHTVTFDTQGGTPIAAQTVNDGGYATEPTKPSKDGLYFLGWFEKPGAELTREEVHSGKFKFTDTAITEDKTLYAAWYQGFYGATYDLSAATPKYAQTGGRATFTSTYQQMSPGSGHVWWDYSIVQGSQVTVTAIPAEGSRFVGWASGTLDSNDNMPDDPSSLGDIVSTDNPYTFTFDGRTALAALFEEIPPTLTLHWTSVDGGDDLVAPIAIEASPGMNVAQALALDDKDMTTDVFATDGYLWSGYQMPKPMSAYKSIDDLKAERVKGTDSIGKGLDIYYVMFKKIDAVEMSVEAPACGTETAMVSGVQTNPPAVTLGEGNYGPAFEDEPTAVWGEWETDHMVFFEGTLTGGNSYPLLARLVADFGYCFADDVTAAVDGATGAQVLLPPDKPAFTLGVSAKVAVEHTPGETVTENVVKPSCTEAGSHDDVVYCTACKEELSRETVTDPALGHDWGSWEVVTKATEEADGLERRTCSRCTEVEERAIPKLTVEYYLAAGASQTHTLKSGTALTFTFKRSVADEKAFAHFAGARVDGKDLAASNFTATEGSVIVTLNAAYLDTLATGSHTLTALFDDGNSVDVAFTVKAKSESKPTNSPASTSGSTKTAAKTAGGKSSGLPKTGDPLAGPTALLLVVAGFVLLADGMRRKRA